jgi:hypothetical protein
VAALRVERNRPRYRDRRSSSRSRHNARNRSSSSKMRRPSRRSASRYDPSITFCWYHRRFGHQAQNCSQPCTYNQQGN